MPLEHFGSILMKWITVTKDDHNLNINFMQIICQGAKKNSLSMEKIIDDEDTVMFISLLFDAGKCCL